MDRTLVGSASQALRRGRGLLLLAFGLSFAVNLLRLTGPIFMILIYDRVLPARSEETLVALFGMVTVFLLAQAVIDYARRRILARFGAQFQERLEVSLLDRAAPGDLLDDRGTKLVSGLDEVDGLRAFFHSASLIAVLDFIWTPMFLFVVFVLDARLGWVCVGGMALVLVLMQLRMGLIGSRADDSDAAGRAISDLRTQLAVSRRTIRAQAMAGGLKARWLRARQTKRDAAIALKDWTVWFDMLCGAVTLFTRYGVLAMGAWLTLEGQMTIGAMVAATFLVTRVIGPVESFLTELPRIREARANWGRLKKAIDDRLAEPADMPAEDGGNPRARLSLANLAVRNPRSGDLILKSVSLDIAPGKMVQIVGSSGKGKTVLAETILGLWRRAGGTILVNGRPLSRLTQDETDRLFGYVPEQPEFVAGTLAENIAHMDPAPDMVRVAAAARRACLHAIVTALPEGYQTRIDAAASTLSRGQRAQLALARAVYHMPRLLILDDPDPMLLEQMPRTLEKTLGQLMQSGGSILILTRKPLAWAQISASHQLDQGRLRPLPSAARIAVVGDAAGKAAKAKPGGSVTKLVG